MACSVFTLPLLGILGCFATGTCVEVGDVTSLLQPNRPTVHKAAGAESAPHEDEQWRHEAELRKMLTSAPLKASMKATKEAVRHVAEHRRLTEGADAVISRAIAMHSTKRNGGMVDLAERVKEALTKEGIMDDVVEAARNASMEPVSQRVADLRKAAAYRATPGFKCEGKPYTNNATDKCAGWKGIDEVECWEKCKSSSSAPGCSLPRERCVAAAYYPKSGMCHHYSKCTQPLSTENKMAVTLVALDRDPNGYHCEEDMQYVGETTCFAPCPMENVPNLQGCADRCTKQVGCTHFVYNNAGHCYLKEDSTTTQDPSNLALNWRSCISVATPFFVHDSFLFGWGMHFHPSMPLTPGADVAILVAVCMWEKCTYDIRPEMHHIKATKGETKVCIVIEGGATPNALTKLGVPHEPTMNTYLLMGGGTFMFADGAFLTGGAGGALEGWVKSGKDQVPLIGELSGMVRMRANLAKMKAFLFEYTNPMINKLKVAQKLGNNFFSRSKKLTEQMMISPINPDGGVPMSSEEYLEYLKEDKFAHPEGQQSYNHLKGLLDGGYAWCTGHK